MPSLRTGELARLADVNVETLRFYERKGLLPVPPRRASGYREYSPEAVHLIQFVQRAKSSAFRSRRSRNSWTFRRCRGRPAATFVALAQRKVADIDAKISDLRAMRAARTKLLTACPGTTPVVRCPIIESLASQAKETCGIRPRKDSRSAEPRTFGPRRSMSGTLWPEAWHPLSGMRSATHR